MNIILSSEKFINNDIIGNSKRIIDVLISSTNSDIEFVFFGEAFLNGFDALSWEYKDDIKMKKDTEDYIKLLGEKAKEYHCGLGFGYYEFIDKKIYSSYLIFDKTGDMIHNYRRVSPGWKVKKADSEIYTEGNQIGEFIYKGLHFGVALCGDIWHREIYDEILNKNFDVLIWPVYVNYSRQAWDHAEKQQYLSKSKTLATHVLYVNSISNEPAYGGSYYQADGSLIEEIKPSIRVNNLLVTLTDNEPKQETLLENLDKLHTTELGIKRIQRNCKINEDVVKWCYNKILKTEAVITRKGKNWYISIDKCIITVNAHSYTIITAHVTK